MYYKCTFFLKGSHTAIRTWPISVISKSRLKFNWNSPGLFWNCESMQIWAAFFICSLTRSRSHAGKQVQCSPYRAFVGWQWVCCWKHSGDASKRGNLKQTEDKRFLKLFTINWIIHVHIKYSHLRQKVSISP